MPAFDFTAATGEMRFTPTFYTPGAVTGIPSSKYALVVKVDEYRRQPNNSYLLVGSVRREITAIVYDPTNQNPELSSLQVNGAPQPVGSVIAAPAGQPLIVQVAGTDPDAGQFLTLSSNAAQLLPGASFVAAGNATTQVVGVLSWTPPATLRPGLYYCTIFTTDNACPILGREHRTLTFRVTNPALATQAARSVTTLAAVPTPFNEQVQFRLASPGVQTVVVFDHLGRLVATLRSLPTGEVRWQPAATVPAGLYLARTEDGRQVARLLRTTAN